MAGTWTQRGKCCFFFFNPFITSVRSPTSWLSYGLMISFLMLLCWGFSVNMNSRENGNIQTTVGIAWQQEQSVWIWSLGLLEQNVWQVKAGRSAEVCKAYGILGEYEKIQEPYQRHFQYPKTLSYACTFKKINRKMFKHHNVIFCCGIEISP